MEDSIEKALSNIIHFGDTDIFPFPFERNFFEEKFDDCKKYLLEIDRNFKTKLSSHPPLTIVQLNQVGYFGFRKATLIEPLWNAYYLALVLSIADDIEKARIPLSEDCIYSYRFEWDDTKKSCFQSVTWNDYRRQCLELSKKHDFIVQTDISDFYSRIYHHKLENELDRISKSTAEKIRLLLGEFSGKVSYGLPVGGPASRILAELALNHADRHLKSRGIKFCRYADDYTIFCDSQSEAYKILILLAEKLANEGLTLQKNKTKIIPGKEFQDVHAFLDPQNIDNPAADEEQKLLNISIRFDPYSETAVEDYNELKDAVKEIDIIGILSREVNKTRIDQTVTKQAINSIRVLDKQAQYHSMRILLDPDNLISLAPVFPSIMRAVRNIYLELDEAGQNLVDLSILRLFEEESHLVHIEINVNYMLQVIFLKHSAVKEELMIKLFENSSNHFLKRQIILIMANWNSHYWLADIKKHFNTFTLWERRPFIYGAYFLGDEGEHWIRNNRKYFDEIEKVMVGWFEDRFKNDNPILP